MAGFLSVKAERPSPAIGPAVQVAFIEGEQDTNPAPEQPRVELTEVRPVTPTLPPLDIPPIVEPVATVAISLPAPSPRSPPAKATAQPAADDTPVVVSSVDYATPLALRYPVKARRTRAEGTVLLRVVIDTTGRPREVEIHRSSGHQDLDVAAREAVLGASFRPHLVNGAPRTAVVVVPIEFKLNLRTASTARS